MCHVFDAVIWTVLPSFSVTFNRLSFAARLALQTVASTAFFGKTLYRCNCADLEAVGLGQSRQTKQHERYRKIELFHANSLRVLLI
jgi:hypothetical protein